ncbi:MAG: zf-HC2 domain-containing protein [Planctomycetota bacterium]|jgi:hypothetical protein
MTDICGEIQESLLFFLEGEESEVPAALIREHLESCPRCKERSEAILALNEMMTTLPRKPLDEAGLLEEPLVPLLARTPKRALPQGFDQQILAAIHEQKGHQVVEIHRRPWRLVRSLAAAAVLAVISLVGYRNLANQQTHPRNLPVAVQITNSLYFNMLAKKDKPWVNSRALGSDQASTDAVPDQTKAENPYQKSSEIRGKAK